MMPFIDITYEDGTAGVLNSAHIVHMYWDEDRKLTVINMSNSMRTKVKETTLSIVAKIKAEYRRENPKPMIGRL
jgi:uncharacterized protein YlzI (FlbEa/FlbD family)